METYEFKVKKDFHLRDIKFWEGQVLGITNFRNTVFWDITQKGRNVLTLSRGELKVELLGNTCLRFTNNNDGLEVEDLYRAMNMCNFVIPPNQKLSECFEVYTSFEKFQEARNILAEMFRGYDNIPICDVPLPVHFYTRLGNEQQLMCGVEGVVLKNDFLMKMALGSSWDVDVAHRDAQLDITEGEDSYVFSLHFRGVIACRPLFENFKNEQHVWGE